MKHVILSLITFATLNSFAANTSVYTSVKVEDCKTIEDSSKDPNAEIDFYTGHCKGLAGYTAVVSGGDIRYSLSLIYKNQEVTLTRIGAFHDMGSDKIEWRGLANSKGQLVKAQSLIYRLSISRHQDDLGDVKNDQNLFVVRLNGLNSCVVGVVKQSGTMNEEARAIADQAHSLPCLLDVN